MSEQKRRAVWSRRLLTLLLAIPACYLAHHLGVALGPGQSSGSQKISPPHSTDQQINGLVVSAADLDLGEAWEDPEYVRHITIRNTTDRTVAVSKLLGGCECTALDPQSFALAPNGTQQIAVKIDLTHRFPHQFGMDQRELAVSVYPVFADRGTAAEGWTIRGVVKSRVSVDGRGITFGDMCGQGGPPVTRTMKATAHVPLAGLEATAPADKATVSVVPAPKRPGGYDVRITPNPNLPLGPFHFAVGLTAELPDGTKHKCVAFAVDGEMRSPVRVVPDPVLLGEHSVGTTAEAVVSIKFPSSGWSVDRIETERTDTMVTPTSPLDDRPTYLIRQPVTKPGDSAGQVRFVCRKPNGQLETVSATVRWYGDPQRAPGSKP
ncbi:MAG: hypothetical protein L0241_10940 [Planctomycetia bacterium]|nr:hypothetical protein [Planctomycetia bacterium]